MAKKLEFLAVVPIKSISCVHFKAYFICKTTNQLISIKVEPDLVDFLLRKEIRHKFMLVNFISLFKKFKVQKAVLQKESEKYRVKLKTKRNLLPQCVEVSFYSGFMISQLLNIPMEVEDKTLKKEGIYIDRKLLEASLT